MRLPALTLALGLCGCAADCSTPNWRERGHDDGFGGHPPQDLRLAAHCPRQGVQFSAEDYMAGWRAGNNEYMRLKTMQDDR